LYREIDERPTQPLRDLSEHDTTWVVRGVDGVAESHDSLPVMHLLSDYGPRAVRRADLVEEIEGATGGAAMEGAAERANRTCDARPHVGPGRRDDPGREGGGVEAVIDGRDQVVLDRVG